MLAQNTHRATQMFPPGTVVGGQYMLRGVLGTGGMGIVFDAWDQELERECALKMLLPHQHPRYALRKREDAAALLIDEAKTHARLAERSIEHFIQIFRRGHHAFLVDEASVTHEISLPYYSMERLKGGDFLRLVKFSRDNCAKIEINELLSLTYQAASALAIAHEMGIVHRDIKLNQFFLHDLLGKTPTVKLLDFGISTRQGDRIRAGTGTSRYAAPELLSGDGAQETIESDIYPFGLSIYELVALRGPFDTVDALQQNALFWDRVHRFETAPSLALQRPDAPSALIEIIDACLDKRPKNRPKAQEIARACAAMLAERLDVHARGERLSELLRVVRIGTKVPTTVRLGAHSGSATSQAGTSLVFVRKEEGARAAKAPTTAPIALSPTEPTFASNEAATAPIVQPEATVPPGMRTLEGLGEPAKVPEQLRVFHSTSEIFDSAWPDDTTYLSLPLPAEEEPVDGSPEGDGPRLLADVPNEEPRASEAPPGAYEGRARSRPAWTRAVVALTVVALASLAALGVRNSDRRSPAAVAPPVSAVARVVEAPNESSAAMAEDRAAVVQSTAPAEELDASISSDASNVNESKAILSKATAKFGGAPRVTKAREAVESAPGGLHMTWDDSTVESRPKPTEEARAQPGAGEAGGPGSARAPGSVRTDGGARLLESF